MPNTSTPAQYVLILIDMAESQGCTRDNLLAGTTLATSGISGIGARINDADFTQVVANAQRLTSKPALGLKLGLRLNLSAHAILGQAFMTCRDLAQVMDLLLKYHHLLASGLQLELETIGEQCVLTLVSTPSDVSVEFGYELFYGAFINTLRGLLNAPDFVSAHGTALSRAGSLQRLLRGPRERGLLQLRKRPHFISSRPPQHSRSLFQSGIAESL